jgi:hypothetical protein
METNEVWGGGGRGRPWRVTIGPQWAPLLTEVASLGAMSKRAATTELPFNQLSLISIFANPWEFAILLFYKVRLDMIE